jgi:uncharacterized membrane protein YkvA (DUF1232 family)
MLTVTANSYSDFVARGTRIVVVTAAWAGHSRMFMPVVEQVERDLYPDCRLALLDSDAEPELTDHLTKAVPSTHVFVDGSQVRCVIGAVSLDEFRDALLDAGVRFARDSLVARPRAEPASRLKLTEEFVARAEVAALADRDALASYIREHSWIAAYGSTDQVNASIEEAVHAIRELPALIAEVEAAVVEPERAAVERLGALAGLLYGAATFDMLADMLPASFGYLDDWLVLNATKWVYIREPEPASLPTLAHSSRLVWNCLPPAVLSPLMNFVGYMKHERTMLQALTNTELDRMLEAQLRRPAPMQFVVPAVQQAEPACDPLGGWTTDAPGPWGDGQTLKFRFNDGSSVAMTRSGQLTVPL